MESKTITTVNPATGHEIRGYHIMDSRVVECILRETQKAHLMWQTSSWEERSEKMRNAAAQLRKQTEELAQLMTCEMGKPIAQSRSEVKKCAWVCDYYGEHAEQFLAPEKVDTDAYKSFVTYEPLGLVLAIMPWNFPLWQVFRCAAPTLMAGNGLILKHASNVMGCALAIEALFVSAGLPRDLFRTLVLPSDRMTDVIKDPLIQAVTLTGSERAGQTVASQAGKHLKKTVMELGGSDPYVILDDADIDLAAEICATSRLINSGQSCIAAKRFVVVRSRAEEFEQKLTAQMKRRVLGDPTQEDTEIGPLARFDLRDTLHQQVTESLDKGARLVLGGSYKDLPHGAFYPATILADVKPGMPAYAEETFGPVAAIITVDDEEEAIRVANDSSYGLGAAVFTQDLEKGEQIAAHRLQAGCCFVNDFVKSDPRLPFGGIKHSGYGRELGYYGIREFVNIKTVSIQKPSQK